MSRFPLAPTLGLVAAAFAGAGCQWIQGPPAKVTVRPSSAQEAAADERLLEHPFGVLAQPEDAIVRIVGPTMTCTGTVIEDDLILTAHHCLVERGPHGEFTTQLIAPEGVRIELGGDYFAWAEVGVPWRGDGR